MRSLRFFSLEKRRLRGDLIALYSFLRVYGERGIEFFSLGSRHRMEGNGSKMHQGRLGLDIKKYFSMEKVVKQWSRLTRVIHGPSITVLKRHWENISNI